MEDDRNDTVGYTESRFSKTMSMEIIADNVLRTADAEIDPSRHNVSNEYIYIHKKYLSNFISLFKKKTKKRKDLR